MAIHPLMTPSNYRSRTSPDETMVAAGPWTVRHVIGDQNFAG